MAMSVRIIILSFSSSAPRSRRRLDVGDAFKTHGTKQRVATPHPLLKEYSSSTGTTYLTFFEK